MIIPSYSIAGCIQDLKNLENLENLENGHGDLETLKSHVFLLENLENLEKGVDDDHENYLVQ